MSQTKNVYVLFIIASEYLELGAILNRIENPLSRIRSEIPNFYEYMYENLTNNRIIMNDGNNGYIRGNRVCIGCKSAVVYRVMQARTQIEWMVLIK